MKHAQDISPASGSSGSRCGLLLLIFSMVLGILIFQTPAWAFVPHVGDRAQDLSGRDLLSQRAVHLEDYQGRWTYLEFTSVNCPSCMKGLPEFVRTSRQYTGQGGLRIIFATTDTASDAGKLRRILIKNDVYFPVLYFGDNGPAVRDSWNVSGWPVAYLISPQGDIAAKAVGVPACLALLRAYAWISQQNPPAPRAGLRTSLGAADADSIDLRLELSSPQHAALRVELDYVLVKQHFGPDGQLVSVDKIKPVEHGPEEVRCYEFNDWGDSVQYIHIDLQGCDGVQYKVRLMLPGSEAQEQGAGFWSEQRGRYLVSQRGEMTFIEWF